MQIIRELSKNFPALTSFTRKQPGFLFPGQVEDKLHGNDKNEKNLFLFLMVYDRNLLRKLISAPLPELPQRGEKGFSGGR